MIPKRTRSSKLTNVAITVILASFALSCERAEASQQQPPAPAPGRYEVVNPVPSVGQRIMLLDTWSGRTWIICDTKDVSGLTATTNSNWCAMEVVGVQKSKP